MEVRKHLKKGKRSMVLKQVESQDVEFISSWRDEYFKVISGFASAKGGGNLIIGVDDDGNPVEMKNSKKTMEHIPNKARNKISIIPSVNCTTREKWKKV